MSDDLLREATRALRAEADHEAEREASDADAGTGVASLTRRRLMASLHERRRRRTTRAVMALPLVAVLVAGTAWAAQSGLLPSIFRPAPEGTGTPAPAEPQQPPPPEAPPFRPRSEPAPIDSTPLVTSAAPPVDDAARLPPEPRPAPSTPAPRVAPDGTPAPAAPPPPSAAPVPSEARRLYERAHRAHFQTRDPSAALAAWDAYLSALPSAPASDAAFATEAAYNRALCLVRLGRSGAARQALTPFAEGRYGVYRQAEARALLDALNGATQGDAPGEPP
jgi:hypothetical protein